MTPDNQTVEQRIQEARRDFPEGAISVGGRWHSVSAQGKRLDAAGNIKLAALGYLPLDAPDSPCPECKGNGRIEMLEHCPTCGGDGLVPSDSIINRIKNGTWGDSGS
jgi:RecJ-like exonuclease